MNKKNKTETEGKEEKENDVMNETYVSDQKLDMSDLVQGSSEPTITSYNSNKDVSGTDDENNKDNRNQSTDNINQSLHNHNEQSIEGSQSGDETDSSNNFHQLSSKELIEKLNQTCQQLMDVNNQVLRAKAEIDNTRKRTQNEIISVRKFAIEEFAQELLTVKDSLDQASKFKLDENQSTAIEKMQEGLQLTLKQFDTVLGKFSVNEVNAAPGIKFDPTVHQAISIVDSGMIEPDHIVDVMQKGFTLNDRLLRPAMVVVRSQVSKNINH